MKFEKLLKAFLRTEQKYHQALNRLAGPEVDSEKLYGVFDDETVLDKRDGLLELYRELEKAEKESKDNKVVTSHDNLIKKIRKELEE